MRLYRSKEHPGHWIGEDELGALMIWPARHKGWTKRSSYTGPRRQLEEADPSEARRTGWPGGPVGRKPRAGGGAASKNVGIRATSEEHETWLRAASSRDSNFTGWARDTLNDQAKRDLDGDTTRRPRK